MDASKVKEIKRFTFTNDDEDFKIEVEGNVNEYVVRQAEENKDLQNYLDKKKIEEEWTFVNEEDVKGYDQEQQLPVGNIREQNL